MLRVFDCFQHSNFELSSPKQLSTWSPPDSYTESEDRFKQPSSNSQYQVPQLFDLVTCSYSNNLVWSVFYSLERLPPCFYLLQMNPALQTTTKQFIMGSSGQVKLLFCFCLFHLTHHNDFYSNAGYNKH